MPDVLTLAPWLDELRAEASKRFDESEMPTDEEEVWRYSRIATIDVTRYSTPASGTS